MTLFLLFDRSSWIVLLSFLQQHFLLSSFRSFRLILFIFLHSWLRPIQILKRLLITFSLLLSLLPFLLPKSLCNSRRGFTPIIIDLNQLSLSTPPTPNRQIIIRYNFRSLLFSSMRIILHRGQQQTLLLFRYLNYLRLTTLIHSS